MKRRVRNILKAGASEGLRMKIAATFLLLSFSLLAQTQTAAKSALDKSTLESYLRYAELWIPHVTAGGWIIFDDYEVVFTCRA